MLPDGAIFCGECGRAVTAAASRRPVAPPPVEQAPPPPLQQPDAHGRRSDPASDAWLPEATLDPATRAWLTGADRRGTEPPAPVPVQRPDDFAPREAPSHVHGAGSGLEDWSGAPGQSESEPPLDPDAYPSEALDADDPERTRIAPAPGRPETPEDPIRDAASSVSDQAARQPVEPQPVMPQPVEPQPAAEPSVPVWAPPAATAPPAAPAGPSWWVGRGTPAAEAPAEPVVPPMPGAPAEPAPEQDAAAPAPDELGAQEAQNAQDAQEPRDAQRARDAQEARDASEPEPDEAIVAASETSATDDQPTVVSPPQPGDTAVVEPLIDRRPPRPAPLVTPGMHETTICHVCGNRLEPDDIFCGECGAVRPAVTAAFTGPVMPLPMTRPDWAAEESDGTQASDAGNAADEPDVLDEPDADPAVPAGPNGSDERAAGDEPDDEIPVDDESLRAEVEQSDAGRRPRGAHAAPVTEPDPPTEASAVPHTPIPPVPGSATVPSSVPSATTAGAPSAAPLPPIPGATGPALPLPPVDRSESPAAAGALDDLDEDVDETRIVAKTPTRAPFVLHFSTGERLGVHGTGLLGRLPRPQPGERYDDLLTVHDPGKSVSKTHLELGRDGDDLWVSDRFSGNGTVVRHIDGSIRRCEPGRRYRVERGARVDIGEQFFLVQ
ncbi:FHA domain-containing protein [Curtobacterium flaccumfaciens pv. flaccumfaciens]|nr:FHA domain-containing protein [Curtobacterium flaccumfaciens]MBO9043377.1 FHA domain-containing protein [Curtobacterium flaccumfaciens pv. flaccumfaciens]